MRTMTLPSRAKGFGRSNDWTCLPSWTAQLAHQRLARASCTSEDLMLQCSRWHFGDLHSRPHQLHPPLENVRVFSQLSRTCSCRLLTGKQPKDCAEGTLHSLQAFGILLTRHCTDNAHALLSTCSDALTADTAHTNVPLHG